MKKYILKGKKVVETKDFIEWGKWLEIQNRIVKQQVLKNGYFVSTVFLGLDHGFGRSKKPIVFETAVFPNKKNLRDVDLRRYATWTEAEKGHKKIVRQWSRK